MKHAQPASADRYHILESRPLRWALLGGVAVVLVIGLALLYLLTQANRNQALYEARYSSLLMLNVVIAALLALFIVFTAAQLVVRLRRGRFGSRLLLRLALIFAAVGLIPGLLIYAVSYQFVSRSIESWFDVKVEGALAAGVNLGQSSMDAMVNEAALRARAASALLANMSESSAELELDSVRDQVGATDVLLWSASGHLIASSGRSQFVLSPERPSEQAMRQARSRIAARIDGLESFDPDKDEQAPVVVKTLSAVAGSIYDLHSGNLRFLQMEIPLPEQIVRNAVQVQEANREYQERALGRTGLRRMYIGTLTLSLFMAVFGAVVLAVLLGNRIVSPLLLIAAGVREVAVGNLRPKAVLQGNDELDAMTRDFALMTQQLADAREKEERSMQAVMAARSSLQTVVDSLTAGVIALSARGVILWSNPGAERILQASLPGSTGKPLAQISGLHEFGLEVQKQFDDFVEKTHSQLGAGHWQKTVELSHQGGDARHATTLVARGVLLPDGTRLLVFDDISAIVSAQRTQAWAEVARRLAHEIRNPLTPIQLSAERLAMKLQGKLGPAEQQILEKSVRTIVEQVSAMLRLVNEFRDYARLPATELHPLQINRLIEDVLHLYGDENATVPVIADLDANCPPVPGDARQLRQIIHNLLQNAQDAVLAAEQRGNGLHRPAITIRTRYNAHTHHVNMTVEDQGGGFADHILQRAFEPYITTKPTGTGLGLAVVRKIADEHNARVDLSNWIQEGVVKGARVSLSFTTANADTQNRTGVAPAR